MPNFVAIAQTDVEISRFWIFQDGGSHNFGFLKFYIFNDPNGKEGRTASLYKILSKLLKLRRRYANILDFRNFNILTVGSVKTVELHYHAKFRRNRSNRGRDMAIFRFVKMAAAAISDFWNFKFLTAATVKGVELHQHAKFRQYWLNRGRDNAIFSGRELAFTFAICYRPSVCRLSVVCLWRWCALLSRLKFSAIFFHYTIAQGLEFSDAKIRWRGRPFSPKIFVQSDPPPFQTAQFRQNSAHSASTVIASEKSSISAYRKSTTRFPTSHGWTVYVTPKSPKGWHKNAISLFVPAKFNFCRKSMLQSFFVWKLPAAML